MRTPLISRWWPLRMLVALAAGTLVLAGQVDIGQAGSTQPPLSTSQVEEA